MCATSDGTQTGVGLWEKQLDTLLQTFLQLPCARSPLPAPFRDALLQPERPSELLSDLPPRLLLQALSLCSPEGPSSCGEGVPAHPLCKHLARALCEWMSSSIFPRTVESIPGLPDEDHLEGKVEEWAGKVLGHLRTLKALMQQVKLHLQVEEVLFLQLTDTSLDTIYTTIKSCATQIDSATKTVHSFVEGDLFLFNKMWLHEVQVGYSSCILSHETKIFEAHVDDDGGSNGTGVLLPRSTLEEEAIHTAPAMQLHGLHESKQPLRIMENILEVLNVEGVKALLGFRATIGSIADALPPPRSLLLASFLEVNGADVAGTKLTVGGKALSKHVHRSSSGWWGPFSGNDEKKNQLALDSITYLIQHACWINVHYMPPNSYVFEARVKEGYGARWTADGAKFRGFLEPQMVDGHARKWRH